MSVVTLDSNSTTEQQEITRVKFAAQDAVARGLAIFPCQPQDKPPLGQYAPQGYKNASRIPTIALKAWEDGIAANVGVACGENNLTVIDVDHGFTCHEDFIAWRDKNGWPPTLTVRTGRRVNEVTGEPEYGAQMYYSGVTSHNGVHWTDGAVSGEIKSAGGYVMGAGSFHPISHEAYEYINDIDIAPIPTENVAALVGTSKAKPKPTKGVVIEKFPQIKAGDRWTELQSKSGTLRNAGLDEDGIFAGLRSYCVNHCEDGENYWNQNEAKYRKLAHDSMTKFEATVPEDKSDKKKLSIGAFSRPAVIGTHRDYVISPPQGAYDGWFPRGDIHVISGSSGSGKSTVMVDLLIKQRHKETVFGHGTNGMPFLVIMADRGANANLRTIERMKIDPAAVNIQRLKGQGQLALTAIKHAAESCDVMPQILFIEGADMLLEDPNKMNIVTPFIAELQELARHYHIAIVCSVGAPKMTKKDFYAIKRDQLFGSVAWGRMTETIVVLGYEDDDDTSPRRCAAVLLRNGPAEKFDLVFEQGRLVLDTHPTECDNSNWVMAQPGWFSAQAAAKATGNSLKTVKKRIAGMLTAGLLDVDEVGENHKKMFIRKSVLAKIKAQKGGC